MLPFMKPKAVAALIIAKRKADGGQVEVADEANELQVLEGHMVDLIRAVHEKNAKAAAEAFKAAFEAAEKYPHAEAEHTDEHSEVE